MAKKGTSDRLKEKGVKHTPEDIKWTRELSDCGLQDIVEKDKAFAGSQIKGTGMLFLEKGNDKAGLQHLWDKHGDEFRQVNPSLHNQEDVSNFIRDTMSSGSIPRYDNQPRGFAAYYDMGNDKELAVPIGKNGFVVSAYPKSKKK